jgi:3-oxoacyl-[acyl-carrier-protein] synthase II
VSQPNLVEPIRACITGIGALTPTFSQQQPGGWLPFTREARQAPPSYEAWKAELDPPFASARLGMVKLYPKERFFTARQLRMMDKAMTMCFVAAAFALEDAGLDVDLAAIEKDAVATVLASAHGETASLFRFGAPLFKPERAGVNPAQFPMIARNVACGQMAIRLGARGWSSMLAAGVNGGAHALARATDLIASGRAKTVLVGAFETHSHVDLHRWGAVQAARSRQGHRIDIASNDWVPVEAACMFVVESEQAAQGRGRKPHAIIRRITHGHSMGDRGQGWPALIERFTRGRPLSGIDGEGIVHVDCASPTDGDDRHVAAIQAFSAALGAAHANPTAGAIPPFQPLQRSLGSRSLFGDAQSVNPLLAAMQACELLSGGEPAWRQALVSALTPEGSYALISLAAPASLA